MTELEEWDFAEDKIRANMWKGFYTAIANVLVFLSLQYNRILDTYASYESD